MSAKVRLDIKRMALAAPFMSQRRPPQKLQAWGLPIRLGGMVATQGTDFGVALEIRAKEGKSKAKGPRASAEGVQIPLQSNGGKGAGGVS